MNQLDVTNACFEGGGAVLTWLNVARIRRDREVKGVDWRVTAFWSLWGLWNIRYYVGVGHPLSAVAGTVLALGNITWVLHAVAYASRPKPRTKASCTGCGVRMLYPDGGRCFQCWAREEHGQ